MHDYELESMHSDDIADAISDALPGITALKAACNTSHHAQPADYRSLGDIQYPYTCYAVSGQAERACKLTEPRDLPADIRGIYLIDPGLQHINSIDSTLNVGEPVRIPILERVERQLCLA
ncbi:MAG: hypothetical protein WAT68_07735 [Candidatus Nitrotoga sp.]